MRRLILVLGVLLATAGMVAGCGKKGPPEAPGKDQFPRQYPAPR